MKRFLPLAALLLVSLASAAVADGDAPIVYSACYYTPPAPVQTAHFHIYRINADGTGRVQLTQGLNDDLNPVWSDDRTRIYFVRNKRTLYWISPDGQQSGIAEEHSGPGPEGSDIGDTWTLLDKRSEHRSPDGQRRLDWTPGDEAVVRRMDDQQVEASYPDFANESPCWLDNKTLLAYDQVNGVMILQKVAGRAKKVPLHRPDSADTFLGEFLDGTSLYAPPRRAPYFVLSAILRKDSSSPTGPSGSFYRVDLTTGMLTLIAPDKQLLSFGPDGQHYATVPERSQSPYAPARPKHGKIPALPAVSVWTAPLQVGDLITGQFTTITTGLVAVSGADWK